MESKAFAASSWHADKDVIILKAAFYYRFLVVFELFYFGELMERVLQSIIFIFFMVLPLCVIRLFVVDSHRLSFHQNVFNFDFAFFIIFSYNYVILGISLLL